MTDDEIPTNDEIRMTKPATAQLRVFRHSGFGFLSSYVIRHSTFGSQKCAVETQGAAGYICSMKLLWAFAVWIGMGTILGVGILMAVKGSPWLLIAGLIGF